MSNNKGIFKKCLFCDTTLTNVKNQNDQETKEHIFGVEACRKLGNLTQNLNHSTKFLKPKKYPQIFKYGTKSAVGEFTHWGVCKNCNNGWMNKKLEIPVGNIIDTYPNLDVDFDDLTIDQQQQLVNWFTKIGLLLLSHHHVNFDRTILLKFKNLIINSLSYEQFLKETGCFLFIDKGNGNVDNTIGFFDATEIYPILKDKEGREVNLKLSFSVKPWKIVVKIAQKIFCLTVQGSSTHEILYTDCHFSYPINFISKSRKYRFDPDPTGINFRMGQLLDELGMYMVYFGGLLLTDDGKSYKDHIKRVYPIKDK